MQNIKLAIKDNNVAKKEDCYFCKISFYINIGLALFLADNYNAVCDKCGEEKAPRLYKLLKNNT